MYGIYANIGGILMVNVTIYGIHTDPMGINQTWGDRHDDDSSGGACLEIAIKSRKSMCFRYEHQVT